MHVLFDQHIHVGTRLDAESGAAVDQVAHISLGHTGGGAAGRTGEERGKIALFLRLLAGDDLRGIACKIEQHRRAEGREQPGAAAPPYA